MQNKDDFKKPQYKYHTLLFMHKKMNLNEWWLESIV